MRLKQLFLRYRNLVPVLILTGLSIHSLLVFLGGSYNMNGKSYQLIPQLPNYIGFGCLLLSITSWFATRKYVKYLAIATVVLGVFNMASFTPYSSFQSWWLKIGSLKLTVTFQPLSAYMCVVYLLLNIDVFIDRANSEGNMAESPLSTEKIIEFRNKFKDLSNEELTAISQDKRYIREAVLAAEELLKERVVP